MTEVERFELCQHLPRFSCGGYIRVPQDLTQAYFADARSLSSMSEELRQAHNRAQQRYAALSPKTKKIADRLLPWILQLRLQYGDECTNMILGLYVYMSVHNTGGSLNLPN